MTADSAKNNDAAMAELAKWMVSKGVLDWIADDKRIR